MLAAISKIRVKVSCRPTCLWQCFTSACPTQCAQAVLCRICIYSKVSAIIPDCLVTWPRFRSPSWYTTSSSLKWAGKNPPFPLLNQETLKKERFIRFEMLVKVIKGIMSKIHHSPMIEFSDWDSTVRALKDSVTNIKSQDIQDTEKNCFTHHFPHHCRKRSQVTLIIIMSN